MGREDGGSAADKARELDRIGRQSQAEGGVEGGLTDADLRKIETSQRQEDYDRLEDEEHRERMREVEETYRAIGQRSREADLALGPSVMDEVDPDDMAAMRAQGLAPDEPSLLTGGMLAALKKPENLVRLAGMGLGLIGLLLLIAGLRAEAQQLPGGAAASATPTAAASASPVAQGPPPVNATGTANASFTKVSGPCNLAARFTDRYSFTATNGALTLTQLSNSHVSRGTITPDGDFTTMADGQGYRGRISGTTAEGQHTYTAGGCNEVYSFTMTFPTAFLAGGTQAGATNRPPEAGAIQAQQVGTSTVYTVQAVRDPDGDPLRYAWTSTNPCGTYTGAATAVFTWAHPHPPCPDEASHPGTITVRIDDGRFVIERQYTRGSLQGTGGVPLAGVGISTIAPSPTVAIPTTTTRPTTTAPATATAGTTTSAGGPNLPLVLFGGLLTAGGLGLFFGGPRLRKEEPKDPCEKEKQAEAEARARREAARRRRDRINDLRAAHDRAQAELERAQREEAASKDDRNVSWGEDAEIGRASRIYTNPDQRARIERAEAAARAAEQAAAAARSAYDAAGDGEESTAAQQGFEDADRDWERADAALKRCLQLNAPPPPAAPPAPPSTGTPGAGGPVTAGPGGGPTVAPPPTGDPTQTRGCPEGTERRRPGATATSASVWIPDLRGAALHFSSDMRANTDFPIDDFLDWAQFTKDSFFAAKKIVSLSEGLGPDGEFPVGGALDLVNFPDFLTYYDEMIDLALKALKKAAEQQALIAKNGDYWLEYATERYELRCEPWQRCEAGAWVNFGKSSFVRTGERRSGLETRRIQVTADPSAIEGAVRNAIDRSFRQLESAKTAAENQARQFAERCR